MDTQGPVTQNTDCSSYGLFLTWLPEKKIADLLTFEAGSSTGFGYYYYELHEEFYFGGPRACVLIGRKHFALVIEYMQLLGMKKELKFHLDLGYWEKGFSTRARFDIGMRIYL